MLPATDFPSSQQQEGMRMAEIGLEDLDPALRADAEQVYQWAVQSRIVKPLPDSAPAALGLTPERFHHVLDLLGTLQLIRSADADGTLVPVSPDMAIDSLLGSRRERLFALEAELLQKRRELSDRQAEVAAFAGAYQRGRIGQGESSMVEVLDEGPAVRALLSMMVNESETEVLTCQPGGPRPEKILNEAFPRDLALLSRGVAMRSLYQQTARYDPATINYVSAVSAVGSQIRTAIELPPRMILIDRKVAFLPHHEYVGGAIIIREESTVRFLNAVFDLAWSTAQPFQNSGANSPTAPDGLDETSIRIVQLLADGYTDKAIGVKLGMSERTVREHVRKLYDLLKVKSRFQAGAAAASRGLIDT
jgi:DNA-binding CsgD family transcriptional regulator